MILHSDCLIIAWSNETLTVVNNTLANAHGLKLKLWYYILSIYQVYSWYSMHTIAILIKWY